MVLNNQQWLICHKTQPNQTETKLVKKVQFQLAHKRLVLSPESIKVIQFNIFAECNVDGYSFQTGNIYSLCAKQLYYAISPSFTQLIIHSHSLA